MNKKLKQFIKESENGKIFSATFTKKDGTERRMNARRGVSKGITGQGMARQCEDRGKCRQLMAPQCSARTPTPV